MDRRSFVVLIRGIGAKELHLISFSWRTAVIPAITALALLSGDASKLEACCGWFGGGWGAGYAPAYTAGYYGGGYGYSSYYGPSYYGGGCGSCCSGCTSPCSYGCGSCGLACGTGCSSCGLGSGYASASGCAPCSGGNCGITNPATNPAGPARPSPDDGFRSGTGGSGRTPPPDPNPANDPYPPRRNTFDSPPAEETTPPTRRRPGRDDGIDNTRGTGSTEPESEPATDANELPLRSKRRTPGSDTSDSFNTNKLPMPETDGAKPKSTTPPDDSFDTPDDAETKTNRPNLGEPADADTIIPSRKKPVPTNGVELPEEEPKALNRDEKDTTQGVAPKTRLAISGRFGTPSIVRLKLRPTSKWLAEPQPEMIASH